MARKAKILKVDDDLDVLQVLDIYLEAAGYEVIEADNGTDAVTMATRERPDLIILDVKMPGKDGYEVMKQLKGNRVTSGIPVIVLTALTAEADRRKALELGAVRCIGKPFTEEKLLLELERVLSVAGSRGSCEEA